MRLSQHVRLHGVDAFNTDDFLFVGEKLSADPARLVLVGGQALEVWGIYFDVQAPTGNAEPLTEDTDWLGSKDDAKWLCSLLGRHETELQVAKDFDPSPNTAIAYVKRPDGRVLMMDFLRSLIGLDSDEVKRLAVHIKVEGVKVAVLHPLLCMESRLANLHKLSSKRNTNGVLQAHWSVDIVAQYLDRLVEQGASARDKIKTCHQIAGAAEFRSGPFCFENYQIDPLRAVTQKAIDSIGGRFATEDWPRTLARIEAKRKKTLLRYSMRIDAQNGRIVAKQRMMESAAVRVSTDTAE